jgi:outer membrane lipoprotein-sorting protein
MPYIPTMPIYRLVPAIAVSLLIPLAALAQQDPATGPSGLVPGAFPGQAAIPGTPKEEPPTDAEKTLDDAVARLKKLASFSADIVQTVDMLSQKFEIKGVYLKASDNRVYLKLAVSGLGDTPATTLQVCDGTTLWDYQQVLDSQTYRKLSIKAVIKKLNDPVLDASTREQILSRLGFAGPETMLAGLRKAVRFNQKSDETFEGKKVWVLRGQWKDRSGLVGPNQQPLSATMPLPPYIPSNIAVWIGQEDGWPIKVEMIGNATSMLKESRQLGPDGRPMGPNKPPPKVDPSKILLRYSNIKLNPELTTATFAFQAPPDAKGVQDGTDEILNYLDQVIQAETMRKKAEAAKSDPVISGELNVPTPTSTPAPAPPK